MSREKRRSNFLKMDSMQTSTNTARKIAIAVGTVITKATWSSMFCKDKQKQYYKKQNKKSHINSTVDVCFDKALCIEEKLQKPLPVDQ